MTTWRKLMSKSINDTRYQRPFAVHRNDLTDEEIRTIIDVMIDFGASLHDIDQVIWDLKFVQYRVYDYLSMLSIGHLSCTEASQVLIYHYLKCDGDVDAFLHKLRHPDLDDFDKWKEVELDVQPTSVRSLP